MFLYMAVKLLFNLFRGPPLPPLTLLTRRRNPPLPLCYVLSVPPSSRFPIMTISFLALVLHPRKK